MFFRDALDSIMAADDCKWEPVVPFGVYFFLVGHFAIVTVRNGNIVSPETFSCLVAHFRILKVKNGNNAQPHRQYFV